jgi:hypothetical protein
VEYGWGVCGRHIERSKIKISSKLSGVLAFLEHFSSWHKKIAFEGYSWTQDKTVKMIFYFVTVFFCYLLSICCQVGKLYGTIFFAMADAEV